MRLAPVRVFSGKHPLRLRKTSPFAVKSIPSFTNFKKSFKSFRFNQSSLRLIYLNPLTRFSRSYYKGACARSAEPSLLEKYLSIQEYLVVTSAYVRLPVQTGNSVAENI